MASTTVTTYTCDWCGATEEYPQSWLAVQGLTKARPAAGGYPSYVATLMSASFTPGPPAPPPTKHYCSPKCLRAAYKLPKVTG